MRVTSNQWGSMTKASAATASKPRAMANEPAAVFGLARRNATADPPRNTAP